MFFFTSCCQNFQTGEGFQIRKPTANLSYELSFTPNLQNINKNILLKQSNQIIKIKKSQYEELLESFKDSNKMWIDQQFPPEKDSLGDLKIQAKWKRLSEIVQNASIFAGKLTPQSILSEYKSQIFQQNSFYCTITALAENEEIIRNLFVKVEYNKAGLYKVPLRIDGQIEQVIIDDFIPIRSNGVPIFSSSLTNEIWLYLLEKVWAKVKGAYTNIHTPPNEIIKAFTWAPCEQTATKQSDDQRKKLWEKLLTASSKKFPCICETVSGEQEVDVSQVGLLEQQIYGILEAFNIEDQKGRLHQVLKMRSYVNIEQLKIRLGPDDNLWSLVLDNQKYKGFQVNKVERENIFYVRYQQFCKYFGKITISLYQPQNNYLSESIITDTKRGFLYKFEVLQEGKYSIQLHQPKQTLQLTEQENETENSYNRATLVLIRDLQGQMCYVDGILTLSDKDTLLSADLPLGKYIVYAKIDLIKDPIMSTQYVISVYSKHFTQMERAQRNEYPDILQRTFLTYGRQNPRNKHNNDLMWISYRLFYKQGGFAFIAVGNHENSNKKFVITFDQKDFNKMNFKLKKPYKNIDSVQTLEVLPGQQKIILARCINNIMLKSLKFPPQLGIKIQPVDYK